MARCNEIGAGRWWKGRRGHYILTDCNMGHIIGRRRRDESRVQLLRQMNLKVGLYSHETMAVGNGPFLPKVPDGKARKRGRG